MVTALRSTSRARPPAPLLPLKQVPHHVAIIMDGNGRWAKRRGLPRLAGHRAGTENVRRVIQRFADYGVKYLTLYAFSTENWARPKQEVRGLMRILSHVIKRETKHFHKNGIRLIHIGDLDGLSPGLQSEVLDAIELTKDNDRMTLCVAFNYGGRAEILDAIRRMLADGLSPDQLDENVFAAYLYTAHVPDPDLIIRTAGEMRVSNFLLWQGAYAEFYSTPACWPDFDVQDIDEALLDYSQRQRRFGGLLPEEADYQTRQSNGRRAGTDKTAR
ncbi:MAG: di-trans,poly-cis-decaprenylcistransferase [Chloroflexi bacterium]|nr:di-trans,poly-cis-decaprenylcistransferase [Chloroflexota bacterium]